jgi:protocatechuate 3,4-dioxygenase beta subunit
MSIDEVDKCENMSRRGALTALLGAGLAIGCGGTTSGSESSDAGGGGDGGGGDGGLADAGGDGATCANTPEGEIGPYFADDSASGFNRSSILSNLDGTATQTGVPLTLHVTVIDAEKGCAPYAGAQVDIWHCNAAGVYSDIEAEGTSADQWLRGYQVTDANGTLTFQTIVPGWYSGRTTHIHLRVRSTYSEASSTTDETNTTQCFFDQAFIDNLYTTVAPYSTQGKNPTTNASDQVYSAQESGANTLVLTGDDTNGYTASITIVLPITATYDASAPGGGAPGGGFPGDGGFPGPPPDGGPGGMFPPSASDGGDGG